MQDVVIIMVFLKSTVYESNILPVINSMLWETELFSNTWYFFRIYCAASQFCYLSIWSFCIVSSHSLIT